MEARRLRDDESAETAATSAGIGRATLVGVVSRDRVRVRTEAGTLRVASLAAAGYLDPEEGDALVVAEGADECFVIGVLGRARLRQPAGSDALAATSDGVVRVARGDLRIEVAEGALHLVARQGVRLRTEETIALHAGAFEADAERAEVRVGDGRVVARTLATTAETIAVVADLVETEAGRLVERAKAAYREVEDLSQTRAGRFRAIARGALQLFGKSASLVADEDAKVDGEKVLLG